MQDHLREQHAFPGPLLAARLRSAREVHGLSLEEVAAAASIAVHRLAQIETWGADPNASELARLATLYEVSLDHLFGADDPGWILYFAADGDSDVVPHPEPQRKRKLKDVLLTDIDETDKRFQFRLSTCDREDLLSSLKKDGQMDPILLWGKKKPYPIIAGFGRFEATKELVRMRIQAFVYEDLPEKEAFILAFKNNHVRRNCDPLERAYAMSEAKKRFGCTVSDLADQFGLATRSVEYHLGLLKYPEHIRTVIDGEVVTFKHAEVMKKYEVKNADKWAKRIREDELDSKKLQTALQKARGLTSRGRPKQYFRKKAGVIEYHAQIKDSTLERELRRMLEDWKKFEEEIDKLL